MYILIPGKWLDTGQKKIQTYMTIRHAMKRIAADIIEHCLGQIRNFWIQFVTRTGWTICFKEATPS